MRKLLSMIIITLLLMPAPVTAARVRLFKDGSTEASAEPGGPGLSCLVNLSLPGECFVLSATFNASDQPLATGGIGYPANVSVALNGTVLWAHNGTGYGSLGCQQLFSNGSSELNARFGPSGGTAQAAVLLPKEAYVTTAVMEVECAGPVSLVQLASFNGSVVYGQLGASQSPAGDFDGDGYDDVLLGAPADTSGGPNAGQAFLHMGGPDMDDAPELTFTGAAGDRLGTSVSGAGDINDDGFADILIGASRYSALANEAGRALVYFGGPIPDAEPELVLNGTYNERFASWVAGTGDLNGDGYGDIAIGTDRSNISNDPGRAYVFFGGPDMDAQPDLTLVGQRPGDLFGWPVSGAGDVNGDGFGDLLVGAILSDAPASNAGSAYLFLGGPGMDDTPDIVFTGTTANGWFGYSLSGAGDVNLDDYADVIIGAPHDSPGAGSSGAAYLFFGGRDMDSQPDLTLPGAPDDNLGFSVSGAGDLNGDGAADVVAGAPSNGSAGDKAGAVRVYFGGSNMDAVPDIILRGAAQESTGMPVSGAGNINGDGRDDLMIGAPYYDGGAGGTNAGRVLVLSQGPFLQEPNVRIGDRVVWDPPGEFAGCGRVAGFSDALNDYLLTEPVPQQDSFGNRLVRIPIKVGAGGEGNLTVRRLNLTYQFSAPVPDFANELNAYIAAHSAERDAAGNLTIPLEVGATTQGAVALSGLDILIDEAPVQLAPIPTLVLDEDTYSDRLMDLRAFFQDDFDPPVRLGFSVQSVRPAGIVGLSITEGHYLFADAVSGNFNDNWTGPLSVVLNCFDSRGLTRSSGEFSIIVREVNDAPVVTSRPVSEAYAGRDYEYRLAAVDAEDDMVRFGLAGGPEGMSLDSQTGILRWKPSAAGTFSVSLWASDDSARSYQNFTLVVVMFNRPPRFVTSPVTVATAGAPYSYAARADDLDGDRLSYMLLQWPGPMTIDGGSGNISWVPPKEASGSYLVVVKAADGKGGEDLQEFALEVQPFVGPRISVARPMAGGTVSGRFLFAGSAKAGTLEVLAVEVRFDSGPWLRAEGNRSWRLSFDTRGLADGEHILQVRAHDALGPSDAVTLRFRVNNSVPPAIDPALLILLIVVGLTVAAGLLLHMRKRRRGRKIYDWGP